MDCSYLQGLNPVELVQPQINQEKPKGAYGLGTK